MGNGSSMIDTILWVDENINNEENQFYCSEIKREYNINVDKFTDINSLYEKMMNIKFKVIMVIISGKFCEDFINRLKDEIPVLYSILITIVFTKNKDLIIELLQKKYSEYLEEGFFNIKNVVSDFNNIKNILFNLEKAENTRIKLGNIHKPKDYKNCFNFEYIDKSEKLIFPYLYKKIMENKKLNSSESKQFNMFLLNNFGANDQINKLIKQLFLIEKVPDVIMSKFWARTYTFDSNFYYNLNWNLMQLKSKKYNPFIQMLYRELKNFSYQDKKMLYRGSIISNEEMEKIEEFQKNNNNNIENTDNFKPKVLIYSRSFLSFSLNEEIAKKFIRYKDGFTSVLFEVLNNANNNSNAILSSFSDFNEEEILFFPYSSFIIKEILTIENQKYIIIILEYLGVYQNIIDKSLEKVEKEATIFNEIIEESPFIKDVLFSQTLTNNNENNNDKNDENKNDENSNNENNNDKKDGEKDYKIQGIDKIFSNVEQIIVKTILEKNEEIKKEIEEKELEEKELEEEEIEENEEKEEKEKEENINQENINYLNGEYDISKNSLNELIQILNCKEKVKEEYSWLKGIDNEKEIKEKCDLYINNKIMDFTFKYKFEKEGKNEIKIIIKSPLINTNFMFFRCSSLISLDLSNLDSLNIVNMNYMFFDCSSLTSLNLDNLNTNNVTNMSEMFSGCSSLTTLNLSSFNTNNVTNMSSMFNYCCSLTSLDLSNFNTNNVTDMNSMFFKCCSLTSLDLSNFDTNNVVNMGWMFSRCFSLITLNLTTFKTHKVFDMNSMFYNCKSLTSLNLSNFDTNNVKNMSWMFYNCVSLNNLNLEKFNINNVNDINYIMDGLNKNCNIISNEKKLKINNT